MNKLLIFPILLLLLLSIGLVSADDSIMDNATAISQDSGDCPIHEDAEIYPNESSQMIDDVGAPGSAETEADDNETYYEEDMDLTSLLNDCDMPNRTVVIVLMPTNEIKVNYETVEAKDVTSLKENLNASSYQILNPVKNKATLAVKVTKEYGCCSFYVQVSNFEAVTGFRRDGTNSVNIHIVKCKWNGRKAVKQYKSNSYFFHTIVTSDGWMVGTGGLDNANINKNIESIAGKMVKSGKISKTYLKKIQQYEKALGLGHFAIKSPNGKYGVVWGSAIYTGKLKPGEYLCVPNGMSCFRHGTWDKFSDNPKDAAVRVAATDPFGINRRGIDVFHWKATTSEGKTTSKVRVYATNDNGQLLGRSSTAHLKDNIYFGKKFISKNKLPKTPSSKYLGTYKFGSIDRLIKTYTVVKAPALTKSANESKTFDITVKNKKTCKAIPNLLLKIKVLNKVYSVRTDSNGVAKFNTGYLGNDTHNVLVYSGNIRYYVSARSTITITDSTV